ncbi:lasso peptide biosynthesis B2 protein [Metabacillus fastidiosus]|uniref:lasso peptide biosynthesis B2 protein n=1 Tax=Metabacillus fastidiosus TaxID=1458 RepID=UPI002E23C224|nr:lasso peptide biosynthesis B2 protein [Metabacillus fastidiosus]
MKFKKYYWYIKSYILVKKLDNRMKKNGFKYIYDNYLSENSISPPKLRDLSEKDMSFIEMILEVVEKNCFHFFGNARCLHRSLVSYHIFREKDIPIDLVIGIMKKPFTSHAWLEFNNQVINDFPETIKDLRIQFHTREISKGI